MFSSGFPYRYINCFPVQCSEHHTLLQYNYSFKGKSNKRYIVNIEKYPFGVYIVKFYLQEHKKFEFRRFQVLTSIGECSRVITTVCNIMIELFHNDPFASFGFIGSPLENENEENTKRFKLYSEIMASKISPISFEHFTNRKKSAYLMINRLNSELNIIDKITAMFGDIYPSLTQ